MRSALQLALVFLMGCLPGQGSTVEPSARQDAIVGGTADTTSTDVFLLGMTFDNGRSGLCSAVLIAPRTLLTAAHCVDPGQFGASSVTVKATNRPTDVGLMASDLATIAEIRIHPMWNGSRPRAFDLALLLLPAPQAVMARPWNREALAGVSGRPVVAVGYGRLSVSEPDSSGTRRAVDTTLTALASDTFNLGTNGVRGICIGDSGGPTFYRFDDGVERLVGIHSAGSGNTCGDGIDVRVDRQAAFLDSFLLEKDPPQAQCIADGRCASGCSTSVDPDCPCAADGLCTLACPEAASDPDCPRDCAANGVCSAAACPRADVDCAGPGVACTADSQCASRLCAADPAGSERYCSQACDGPESCPAGLVCEASLRCLKPAGPRAPVGDPCTPSQTRCAEDTVCSGRLGGSSTCRPACPPGDACPEGTACIDGLNAARFCDTPSAEPAPPRVDIRGGCSATATQGFALMAWVVVRRRGRTFGARVASHTATPPNVEGAPPRRLAQRLRPAP